MSWERKLWGVEFQAKDRKILIGTLWNDLRGDTFYEGEPPHALLFTTRALARAWCKGRGNEFHVVRVIETVKKI